MEYKTNDLVIPILSLPDPCPIRIEITERDVLLFVGPRDWQWDKKTGKLVGSGTAVAGQVPESLSKKAGTAGKKSARNRKK